MEVLVNESNKTNYFFDFSYLYLRFLRGRREKNPGGSGGAISRLNLSGASSLAIVPTSAVQNSSLVMNSSTTGGFRAQDTGVENTLVKITSDGIKVVETYDGEGKIVQSSSFNPTNIYNVNSQYFITVFNSCTGYLVQKATGFVYALTHDIDNFNDYFTNITNVYSDDSDNIYYKSSNKVIKINVQNPSRITAETISQSMDEVSSFIINKAGNLLYKTWMAKVIISTQSSFEVVDSCSKYWKGLDDSFYFSTGGGSPKIQKVIIEGSNINYTDFGPEPFYLPATSGNYLLSAKDRIIMIDTFGGKLYRVYPDCQEITLPGLTAISQAVSSENYYYLAGTVNGKQGLLKVDPSNNSSTPLCTGYRIYKMVVSSDDTVTFNAFESSSNKNVIGTINSSGGEPIIDRTIEAEVIELVRIN